MKLKIKRLDTLVVNPFQTRITDVNSVETVELAHSIRDNGLLQPILIDSENTIIAGHRRYEAYKILQEDTIECIVVEVNDNKKLLYNIIENLQRENLSIMETALAFQQLQLQMNVPQSELAHLVKKSSSYISKVLSLLTLDEKIKDDMIVNKRRVNRVVLDRLSALPKPLYEFQKDIYFDFIEDEIDKNEAIHLINEKLNYYYNTDYIDNKPKIEFSKNSFVLRNINIPESKYELVESEVTKLLDTLLS